MKRQYKSPSPTFWRAKRVLITGHTGFKGAWLSLALSELGAKVSGYALAPSGSPNLYTALQLDKKISSVIADVRDQPRLNSAVKEFSPDIIIHMAAETLVRESYKRTIDTFNVNMMGTVYLLDACRSLDSLRVCLNVTTDKVYENSEKGTRFKEENHLGGYDPYSASKACSEIITQSFYRSFLRDHKVAVLTARCGNVFGGGDFNQDRIVADAVRAFSCGKPLLVRNPSSIRPWLHVFDSLRGYLLAIEKAWKDPTKFSRPWNFAPPTPSVTVKELVDLLAKAWGEDASWKEAKKTRSLHEAKILNLSPRAAATHIGWIPLLSLYEGVELTVRWYKYFYSSQDDLSRVSKLSKDQLVYQWGI